MTDAADPLRSTAREALERAEKAWPGPWLNAPQRVGYYEKGVWRSLATMVSWEAGATDANNALFIARARTDVPILASAVLDQADTIVELRAEVEELREQIPEDLGTCPYLARWHSLPGHDPKASCSFGCTDEPQCVTCQPSGGWPSQWPGIIERQTAQLAELRAEVERLRAENQRLRMDSGELMA